MSHDNLISSLITMMSHQSILGVKVGVLKSWTVPPSGDPGHSPRLNRYFLYI